MAGTTLIPGKKDLAHSQPQGKLCPLWPSLSAFQNLSANMSGEEIEKQINEQGGVIRELKSAKADKAEIDAAVKTLLELKAKYKEVTGKDHVGAGKGSSKKDKKKKKKEADETKDGEPKLTKKQLRILAKEKKAKEAAAKKEAQTKEQMESGKAKFGVPPMIQSTGITDRSWTDIRDLSAGTSTWVRAHLMTVRASGRCSFIVLRQGCDTVQAVLFQSKTVPKEMLAFAASITKESVVDVYGKITRPGAEITSTSQGWLELQVEELFVVSKADPILPFQLEDASRSEVQLEEVDEDGTKKYVSVGLDTRLNTRTLDARTPANHAILKIVSGVGMLFREFLQARGFVEVHTPKLIAGASEGGADVFKLDYFGREACLAQSPQLYKQMASANAGLERVFEIGPVFRAENSNTYRHMTEFTGLDMEMVFHEHYFEVLDVFSDMFIFIFDNLEKRFAAEIAAVRAQFPFEPLQYCKPSLRLTFQEGMALLREAGCEDVDEDEDPTTEQERMLGRIVKEKYGTDFFIMDKYPLKARPFYTMPDPENPRISNSYDMFIRGNEIVSGAQRVHDFDLLQQRAKEMGVPLEGIKHYCDSFKYGSQPHGGGGIGLDRVVMLYLDLDNVRKAALFPRDPKRIEP